MTMCDVIPPPFGHHWSRFDHAPLLRGATRNRYRSQSRLGHFNPRTRVGATGDPVLISTHPYFNPRTREGCDVKLSDEKPLVTMVSIHAPIWVRQRQPQLAMNTYFNPRTHNV